MRGDHGRLRIKASHRDASSGKFRSKNTVAATDVEQRLARDRPEHFDEELLLKRFGDLAKAARLPAGVGLDQPRSPLRSFFLSAVVVIWGHLGEPRINKATIRPETKVSAATAPIAHAMPNKSAITPAERAPIA